MKYLFLTETDSNGMSEVFHSTLLPEDLVPEGMVERWNSLVESSPVVGKFLENKKNVALGSIWNEQSQELILPEGLPEDKIFPEQAVYYVFFVDNVVTAMLKPKPITLNYAKFKAALAAPVTFISVEDSHPADVGYTYNGSTFFAPESI